MPRIVNTAAPADSGRRVRRRSPMGDWNPYEDWTGHHPIGRTAKPMEYGTVGRDVMKGKKGERTMPTMPGGKGGYRSA